MIRKNKWTLLTTALLTVLVFATFINVISYQNRVQMIGRDEQAKAEELAAQQTTDPEPVEQTIAVPEPKEYKHHIVSFSVPEGVTVDLMHDPLHGPSQTGIESVEVLNGEDIYFTLNADLKAVITSVTVEGTDEELSSVSEEGKRPVYHIENIRSAMKVVITAEERSKEPTSAPEPAPSGPSTITFVSTVTKPTCTEPGFRWNECLEDFARSFQDQYVPPLGHKWHNGVCTRCGAKDPSFKFTWTLHTVTPSCTEQGFTEHLCREDPSKNYTDSYVPALGHDYDRSGKCKRCGHIKG